MLLAIDVIKTSISVTKYKINKETFVMETNKHQIVTKYVERSKVIFCTVYQHGKGQSISLRFKLMVSAIIKKL